MTGAVTWHRSHGRAVIDLASPVWREFVAESGITPDAAAEHLERSAKAGRTTRLSKGLYLIVDSTRPADLVAIASQAFEAEPHYVTTDAAMRHHLLTEHTILQARVVVPSSVRRLRRGFQVGTQRAVPVNLGIEQVQVSEYTKTLTASSNRASVADPEQAVADAFARPAWCDMYDLLPEFLAGMRGRSVHHVADLALRRSRAAGQRLGYALDLAGIAVPRVLQQAKQSKGVQYNPRHKSRQYVPRWALYVDGPAP